MTLPMEYDITLEDERKIASVGTVTFVLRLEGERYAIEHIHWSSRRRKVKPDKATALATETAAAERAMPSFKAHCGSCHAKGGKNTSRKARNHFDMTAYPFGGHHAHELGRVVAASLWATDQDATMPKGKPGSVTGDDRRAILEWAHAFEQAAAAGAHRQHEADAANGHSHGH